MMEPLLDPEEHELEQNLLRAGRDVHMSHRLQAQTLAALGVGAVSLTAAATAQAGSIVWFKSKVGVLLLSIGGTMGAIGAGYFVAAGTDTESSATTQGQSTTSQSAAHAPTAHKESGTNGERDHADSPESDVPTLDKTSETTDLRNVKDLSPHQDQTKDARQLSKAKTSLADELDHITRATSALNREQPQVALAILGDYQKRFPQPQLGLEVEVLRIEALAKSGNQAEAQNRANRFIARYPNSALVARVKRILR
jgi:hypothetical protein